MPKDIDLWFSAGSTYTYLTMMRIDGIEATAGVKFTLRPFYLGMIFKELNRFLFVEEPNLSESLRTIGQDPARILAKAAEPATHDALVAETGIARSLGIFGSPSFVVGGGELFWGDDRLEDAVRWAVGS